MRSAKSTGYSGGGPEKDSEKDSEREKTSGEQPDLEVEKR